MNASNSTSTISRGAFLRALAFSTPLLPAAMAQAQDPSASPSPTLKPDPGNLRTFVELARSDIRTEKTLIIAENIKLTDDEAIEFWPVHREYDIEYNRLLDQRLALIVRFAEHYGSMTEAQAKDLATRSFDLEEKRTALKRKYFKQFSKIIPAVKAARFFQIENQLNMALDLQVAGALPLIK